MSSEEEHEFGTEINGTTYGLYPNTEKRIGETIFYRMGRPHFIDYLNLLFYAGGAFIFFYYFVGNFDSLGYMAFIFGIIIFCELIS